MNYNDKNNKNVEIDDMNIKSHLNASLDLSGISVSEDLINRTLEAIGKQKAEQQADTKDTIRAVDATKKVIPWSRYIRAFAGVAAAVVIIVGGYGLLSNAGSKKSSTDSATEDWTMAGAAAENPSHEYASDTTVTFDSDMSNSLAAKDFEAAAGIASTDGNESDTTADQQDIAAEETAPLYSIMADASLPVEREETYGPTGTTNAGEAKITSERSTQNEDSVPLLTFRDIFLPDPSQAQSITITDETNGTFITLTNQEEILDFYSVMDKHQFTYTSNSDSAKDKNYTVEITAPQQNEAVYTMTAGSNIIVSYTEKDVASQSIYSVADNALLLQELKDFFNKYYK